MKSGRITLINARVYLGAAELVERRAIAKRVRALAGRGAEKPAHFSLEELVPITQEFRTARLRRALGKLERLELLGFDSKQIELTRYGLLPDDPLCLELKKRGALSRLVPIPRRLYAELCREK